MFKNCPSRAWKSCPLSAADERKMYSEKTRFKYLDHLRFAWQLERHQKSNKKHQALLAAYSQVKETFQIPFLLECLLLIFTSIFQVTFYTQQGYVSLYSAHFVQ